MLREDKSFGEIVRKSLLAMPQDQVSTLDSLSLARSYLVLVSDVRSQRLSGVRKPVCGGGNTRVDDAATIDSAKPNQSFVLIITPECKVFLPKRQKQ